MNKSIVIFAVCTAAAFSNVSKAARVYFTISLDGQQAGTISAATGTGTATLDTDSLLMTWSISFTGLTNGPASIREAYFQLGTRGINGPVLAPPGNIVGPGTSPIAGSATIDATRRDRLLAGGIYFIINTTAYPAGEIRGQLIPDKMEIAAKKDNTIFEDAPTSNGAGPLLIVGTNNSPLKRRGLIMFDIIGSGIPAGSVITSSVLRLYNLSNSIQLSCEIKLHRLLKDWGEGTSSTSQDSGGAPATTNDATWLHNFYPSSFWTNQGGDFSDIASAGLLVPTKAGFFSWTSQQLASDVQHFLEQPANNFGWMLIGNETQERNKKYLASRQHSSVACHPLLMVTYTPPDMSDSVGDLYYLAGDWNTDGRVDYTDLELFAANWLADCNIPGQLCCDLNMDNITNMTEFTAMAQSWLVDCGILPVDPRCIPK